MIRLETLLNDYDSLINYSDNSNKAEADALEMRIDAGLISSIPYRGKDKELEYICVPLYIYANKNSLPSRRTFEQVLNKYADNGDWGAVYGFGYWNYGANIYLLFSKEWIEYDVADQLVNSSVPAENYIAFDIVYPMDTIYNIMEYEELRLGEPLMIRDEEDKTQRWHHPYPNNYDEYVEYKDEEEDDDEW